MAHPESVPVDQRWLGMDKRGIPYAIVAVALILALHWAVPAIDNATKWDNPTVAGDVIDLGSGIRITPPVGWQLEEGVRTTDDPIVPVNADALKVTLSNGAVTVAVAGAKWDGTADQLLDQYNKVRETSDEKADQVFAVTGDRSSFVTSTGVTGVQEAYTSAGGDGRVFAFVVDDDSGRPIGIVVTATGTDGSLGEFDSQIQALVSSLTTTEPAR
jgi:hypothetical protein